MTWQKGPARHCPTVHFTSVLEPWQQMAGACWHLTITILLPFLINCHILQFTCVHKCHQMSRKCQGLGHEDGHTWSLCMCRQFVQARVHTIYFCRLSEQTGNSQIFSCFSEVYNNNETVNIDDKKRPIKLSNRTQKSSAFKTFHPHWIPHFVTTHIYL